MASQSARGVDDVRAVAPVVRTRRTRPGGECRAESSMAIERPRDGPRDPLGRTRSARRSPGWGCRRRRT